MKKNRYKCYEFVLVFVHKNTNNLAEYSHSCFDVMDDGFLKSENNDS